VPLRFARAAAKVKVLFPEDTQGLQVEAQLLETIEGYRKSMKWNLFGRLAANTVILIADKVRVIDGSIKIEFEHRETFNQDLRPLSIQRNF
jgi:hypothetical protein